MKNFKYTKTRVFIASILAVMLIIFCAFTFSCSGKNSQTANQEISSSSQEDTTKTASSVTQTSQIKNEVKDVSVDDISGMLKDKNKYFLLDVRTLEEHNNGFIENSILIPITELESRLSEIPTDKPVIVYCGSGNRSAKAAGILVKNNFNPVYNMLGGITEWINKGYPVVK